VSADEEPSLYRCMACGAEAETVGEVSHYEGDRSDGARPGCRAWDAWDALSDLGAGVTGVGPCEGVEESLRLFAAHIADAFEAFMVRKVSR
jgi:hypothetical protein